MSFLVIHVSFAEFTYGVIQYKIQNQASKMPPEPGKERRGLTKGEGAMEVRQKRKELFENVLHFAWFMCTEIGRRLTYQPNVGSSTVQLPEARSAPK